MLEKLSYKVLPSEGPAAGCSRMNNYMSADQSDSCDFMLPPIKANCYVMILQIGLKDYMTVFKSQTPCQTRECILDSLRP